MYDSLFYYIQSSEMQENIDNVYFHWGKYFYIYTPTVYMTIIFKQFSETIWPIKAKFYVKPPWEGGTKVYINCPGHMTYKLCRS